MKVLGHYIYPPLALLVAVEFGIAVAVFVGVEFAARLLADAPLRAAWPLLPAATFGIAVIVGLTAVGLFQPKQRLRIEGVLVRIVVGLAIAVTGLALISFLGGIGFGGAVWTTSFIATALALGVSRTFTWRWLVHDLFHRRILVFGAGKQAASLLKLRRRSDRIGFEVVAFVPAEGDEITLDDARVERSPGSLFEYAQVHDVDEIVMAMDDRRRGFPIADLLKCKVSGVGVVELLAFLERETGRVNINLVNPSWLIFADGFGPNMATRVVTRAVDLAVSLTALVVALPVLIPIAAAIAIADGFPVLYRQLRVGKGGKVFMLYKFRSMVRDAEAGGAPQWAKADDKRVTKVGAILRKMRFDELPQLVNVIKGDMSLVGPRPERPEFVRKLSQQIPYYEERHVIKPGITGWAQLSYPYGASEHDAIEKLQYDLYYIKHKSVVFDLVVLLQTAEVVLWGKGAR